MPRQELTQPALPALWEGAAPALVLRTVLEVLARLLDLQLAYARWNDGPLPLRLPLELARSERDAEVTTRAREIGGQLAPMLRQQWPGLAYTVPHPFATGDLRITQLWLGMSKESGFLLAGSRRPGFPTPTEMVLLRVAANQVAAEFQRVQLSATRLRADAAERPNGEMQARNTYLHEETERFWGDLIGGSKALEATQALASTHHAVHLARRGRGAGMKRCRHAGSGKTWRRHRAILRTMNVPAILDIEASGFGRGSYPVEVGYVLEDGASQCMLVRPAPGWNHWDPAAQELHRITRADLLECGLPTDVVAEELNHRLCGRTLYTDAWGHDYSWLALLYDVAGRAPTFRLESLQALLTETEIAHWATLKEQAAIALGLPRHRACADARLLQATFGRLRCREHVALDRTPARPSCANS